MQDIEPATKEQRDLLFQKMHEAGYEWDAEHKQLKKIEQKPINEKAVFEVGETITDGTSTFTIVDIVDGHYIADDGDKVCFYVAHKYYTLIKEQKPAWSEEDERLFQIVIDILDRENHLGNISHIDLIACVRKLKSLRPQNTWKPSDYELEVLRLAAEKDGACLMGLYEQLKKLKS